MTKHISIIKSAINKKYSGDVEKIEWWMAKFTAARRFRLTKRWNENPHCHYCSTLLLKPGEKGPKKLLATYDHKTPQDLGGSEKYDNCILCCQSCNSLKRNLTYQSFLDKISEFGSLKLYKKALAKAREKKFKDLHAIKKSKLKYLTYLMAIMCFDKNIKTTIDEISC